MNIIENINMALFRGYFVPNANIIVQTGEISNETTIQIKDDYFIGKCKSCFASVMVSCSDVHVMKLKDYRENHASKKLIIRSW